MSCPFYWYNHHYACRKSGKDVNEDTYYKYCRNYDYDDCPIYKGNDSGGCFLTSACTEARGLPDDCRELTAFVTDISVPSQRAKRRSRNITPSRRRSLTQSEAKRTPRKHSAPSTASLSSPASH